MTDKTKLGKYEILEELGRGGFGVVYKARDTVLDRTVAVKVLHPNLVNDLSFVSRFRNEARLAAQLDHPNIVPVYDFGEYQGLYYIVMGHMPGGSLKEMLQKEGTFSEKKAFMILRQVSDGLSYAHKKGIIHRDLKPGNILFDEEGQARISDLGFAKALHADLSVSLTMSGGLVGTPAYMAPEAWRNTPACSQTDIYSLGCIFYEMLTGKVLFEGTSPAEVMTMHIIDEPKISSSFPDKWNKPLLNSLAKEPSKRYPDTKSFLDDLENALKSAERKQNTRPSTKSPKCKILSGHTGNILSVDWSSGGDRIASGGLDHDVMIWHSETGEKLRILEGHETSITCVEWSPDGKLLASSDNKSTIIFWDSFNGKILRRIGSAKKAKDSISIMSLSWSPDGKRIASAGWMQPNAILDVESGKQIMTFGDDEHLSNCVTWSPNGKILAVDDFFDLKLWDIETGKITKPFKARPGPVNSFTWSPDGMRIAFGYVDGTIVIWYAITGEQLRVMQEHSDAVKALAWSLDGTKLASGSWDHSIYLWDPDRGLKIKKIGEHPDKVTSLSWSPNSKYLASAGNDWDIRIWQV